MTIYIGADHRGFELKEKLKEYLSSNHIVEDLGAHEFNAHDDYVDFAEKVGRKVAYEEARLAEDGESKRGSRGIVICGSGAGASITTNKIKGIRAFIGFDPEQTKSARTDDDVNVIALASNYLSFDHTKNLVDAFLNTPFDPRENHTRRLEKIKSLES